MTTTSEPASQREKTLVAIAGTGLGRKMRERPLTIATYAAGASLAAATLVYVFGPTFFLDDDAANSSRSSRKKGVVGLVNPANDCFINSTLQVLAGLPELRAYLIREVHRRKLEHHRLNHVPTLAQANEQGKAKDKKDVDSNALSVQQGALTAGLKDILDALNERPIYKKTISANPFIRTLEQALRKRINRNQQDAQEFLQVVLERLSDERDAGVKVRLGAHQQRDAGVLATTSSVHENSKSETEDKLVATSENDKGSSLNAETAGRQQSLLKAQDDDDNPFPLTGKLESFIECVFCSFKPKASTTTFQTLTLNVPFNEGSTTLNACFDGLFKIEHIEDFVCDRCRLEHALQVNETQLETTTLSSTERAALQASQSKIKTAIQEDPEQPPQDVALPPISTAPKRRITRHTRVSAFPQLLSIHLSRSVWDHHAYSTKNLAKVSFPETLTLGGLLDRRSYRLLGVVCHKGMHHSGHYETFRRQISHPPFSTPNSMGTDGIYSVRSSPASSVQPSVAPSPHMEIIGLEGPSVGNIEEGRPSATTQALPSLPLTDLSEPSEDINNRKNLSPQDDDLQEQSFSMRSAKHQDPSASNSSTQPLSANLKSAGVATPAKQNQSSILPPMQPTKLMMRSRSTKRKNSNDRWWRISDEKIKECKTSDVLGMQQEVYMLFYELLPAVGMP